MALSDSYKVQLDDGGEFTVEEHAIRMMKTLQQMVEALPSKEPIPLSDVSSEDFAKILGCCNRHKDDPVTLTDEGFKAWLESSLSEYDTNFVNYRTNIEELYRLFNASFK